MKKKLRAALCAIVAIAGYSLLLGKLVPFTPLPPIDAEGIVSIHVYRLLAWPDGDAIVCSGAQIHLFVYAYEMETYFRDDVGTTPHFLAKIRFADGRELAAWDGNTQGFCTVLLADGSLHNTTAVELQRWFNRFR
jgi:hypothetical protein